MEVHAFEHLGDGELAHEFGHLAERELREPFTVVVDFHLVAADDLEELFLGKYSVRQSSFHRR